MYVKSEIVVSPKISSSIFNSPVPWYTALLSDFTSQSCFSSVSSNVTVVLLSSILYLNSNCNSPSGKSPSSSSSYSDSVSNSTFPSNRAALVAPACWNVFSATSNLLSSSPETAPADVSKPIWKVGVWLHV